MAEALALTTAEQQRLADLEELIRGHKAEFLRVGAALIEIRDQRLYRERFDSFEKYCNAVHGFTRTRGYQLIDAATVRAGLPGSNANTERGVRDLPRMDKQLARERLAGMSPEQQRDEIARAERELREAPALAPQPKPDCYAGPDGRRDRINATDRLIARAIKLAEGLGDESGEVVRTLAKAREKLDLL